MRPISWAVQRAGTSAWVGVMWPTESRHLSTADSFLPSQAAGCAASTAASVTLGRLLRRAPGQAAALR